MININPPEHLDMFAYKSGLDLFMSSLFSQWSLYRYPEKVYWYPLWTHLNKMSFTPILKDQDFHKIYSREFRKRFEKATTSSRKFSPLSSAERKIARDVFELTNRSTVKELKDLLGRSTWDEFKTIHDQLRSMGIMWDIIMKSKLEFDEHGSILKLSTLTHGDKGELLEQLQIQLLVLHTFPQRAVLGLPQLPRRSHRRAEAMETGKESVEKAHLERQPGSGNETDESSVSSGTDDSYDSDDPQSEGTPIPARRDKGKEPTITGSHLTKEESDQEVRPPKSLKSSQRDETKQKSKGKENDKHGKVRKRGHAEVEDAGVASDQGEPSNAKKLVKFWGI